MTELVLNIVLISTFSFLSALVTSILGFGAGLVLTPLLVFIMPLKEALGVGALIFLVTSASKTWWFKHDIDKRVWIRCLPLSLVGIIAGMVMVQYASEKLLTIIFAVVLVYFALQSVFGCDASPGILPQFLYPLLAGMSSILVHAAGVFYYRYCRMNNLDRVTTVATMAALHFTLNIFKALFFVGSKLVDTSYLFYLIPAYILSIIGTRLGRDILKNYVSERMFASGVSFLLVCLAIRMIWVLYFPAVLL